MRLNVALLGGGSWGTTVAAVASRNAPVTLWARDADTIYEINRDHRNSRYLPGSVLPPELRATPDLEEAVGKADVVVIGIPSHSFAEVLREIQPLIRPWVPVVSLTKGLDPETGLRMSELVAQMLPGHPVAALTGPNLAREVMQGRAAASVIAMEDPLIVKELQRVFHSGLFRVYTNSDVVGCELGGVLKNVIAIAAGMGDGLGAGDNTRSALITRGLAEVTRLGVALGGRPETFAGLAGMGDLIATCTSPLSRNRHVGTELAKGRSLDAIISEMRMVAEGVKTAPRVMALAERYDVLMPISLDVHDVLTGRKAAADVFKGLIRSAAGSEAEAG